MIDGKAHRNFMKQTLLRVGEGKSNTFSPCLHVSNRGSHKSSIHQILLSAQNYKFWLGKKD